MSLVATLGLGHAQSALDDALTNGSAATPPLTNRSPAMNPGLISGTTSDQTFAAAAKENERLGFEVGKLCASQKFDAALEKVRPLVQSNPKNLFALSLRGYIYAREKKWDFAQADFEAMLQINAGLAVARFDLAELKFLQKDYAGARSEFAALVNDPDLADLASYKVFLCDLFGEDPHKAKEELEVFSLAGMNPSYYFGNAAWDLYHGRPDAARPWIAAAARIYYPAKAENYARSLYDLGYLPLPPSAPAPAPDAPAK